ncbi:phage scaffolding protein [Anaerocolumna sp. AGMB13025]|uniref:phage scaffolding protein n=1 Tax=Anaerocolumna sp. AGMB13025 TaxID=3039116 RepID=UPI00241EA187|nr:phage scaffolding protein [Anaerocolumna sp. AGMB13025]WFR57284.1 phage scaffolding protein [Anaerocolumna sp. AGMB13025]
MKKEQFIKLGFTEEMAEKAVDILKEELKGYIPKSRFDQVNDVKKELERKLATLEVQRKEQNASKLTHQELEKIIRDILSTNAAIKAEQEAKMKDLLKELAIRHTLGKFQYTDLLIGMFDKSRLSVAEDGTVTGIKEQLEEIKTSYEGLFRI